MSAPSGIAMRRDRDRLRIELRTRVLGDRGLWVRAVISLALATLAFASVPWVNTPIVLAVVPLLLLSIFAFFYVPVLSESIELDRHRFVRRTRVGPLRWRTSARTRTIVRFRDDARGWLALIDIEGDEIRLARFHRTATRRSLHRALTTHLDRFAGMNPGVYFDFCGEVVSPANLHPPIRESLTQAADPEALGSEPRG